MQYHSNNRQNLPLPGEDLDSDNLPNSEASDDNISEPNTQQAAPDDEDVVCSEEGSENDPGSNYSTSPVHDHQQHSSMYMSSAMGAEHSRVTDRAHIGAPTACMIPPNNTTRPEEISQPCGSNPVNPRQMSPDPLSVGEASRERFGTKRKSPELRDSDSITVSRRQSPAATHLNERGKRASSCHGDYTSGKKPRIEKENVGQAPQKLVVVLKLTHGKLLNFPHDLAATEGLHHGMQPPPGRGFIPGETGRKSSSDVSDNQHSTTGGPSIARASVAVNNNASEPASSPKPTQDAYTAEPGPSGLLSPALSVVARKTSSSDGRTLDALKRDSALSPEAQEPSTESDFDWVKRQNKRIKSYENMRKKVAVELAVDNESLTRLQNDSTAGSKRSQDAEATVADLNAQLQKALQARDEASADNEKIKRDFSARKDKIETKNGHMERWAKMLDDFKTEKEERRQTAQAEIAKKYGVDVPLGGIWL